VPDVEITFIGSGDAFGSGGRFQTCIRVRAGGATALVDCGATSLTAMRAQGVDPGSIETVVISHLHGDHFGGLPFLVLDGQFTRRTAPLTVLGPVGTRDRLHAAMETLYPGSAGVRRRFEVEVVELDGAGGPHRDGPLTVRSWEVDHASGAPALAVRVDAGGHAFGYSGDTAWTPALAAAADGADVFACEAYTWDQPVRYHLDYRTLREHADELAAGRLVLTHMGPKMLARLREAEHAAAVDGLVLHAGML
jgi:ribonuclease BN (tRNA processing enzyme)